MRSGFSFLELMVVLVILGLLAGLGVPRLMDRMSGAKARTARVQVEALTQAVDLFQLDVGRLPAQGEGLKALTARPANAGQWNGPYIDKESALIDPWGAAYVYANPGRHLAPYDIWSLGADGKEGGEGENKDVRN